MVNKNVWLNNYKVHAIKVCVYQEISLQSNFHFIKWVYRPVFKQGKSWTEIFRMNSKYTARNRRCPNLCFLPVINRVHLQNLRQKLIITLWIPYQSKPLQCMVIPPRTHQSEAYKQKMHQKYSKLPKGRGWRVGQNKWRGVGDAGFQLCNE